MVLRELWLSRHGESVANVAATEGSDERVRRFAVGIAEIQRREISELNGRRQALGLAPIGWGLMIDAIGSHAPVWLGLEWNRFTVFFAVVCVAFGVSFALSRKLEEREAASLEELLRDFLIQSPQRFWLRFWPRG